MDLVESSSQFNIFTLIEFSLVWLRILEKDVTPVYPIA